MTDVWNTFEGTNFKDVLFLWLDIIDSFKCLIFDSRFWSFYWFLFFHQSVLSRFSLEWLYGLVNKCLAVVTYDLLDFAAYGRIWVQGLGFCTWSLCGLRSIQQRLARLKICVKLNDVQRFHRDDLKLRHWCYFLFHLLLDLLLLRSLHRGLWNLWTTNDGSILLKLYLGLHHQHWLVCNNLKLFLLFNNADTVCDELCFSLSLFLWYLYAIEHRTLFFALQAFKHRFLNRNVSYFERFKVDFFGFELHLEHSLFQWFSYGLAVVDRRLLDSVLIQKVWEVQLDLFNLAHFLLDFPSCTDFDWLCFSILTLWLTVNKWMRLLTSVIVRHILHLIDWDYFHRSWLLLNFVDRV